MATAQAQSGMNRDTAQTQQITNMTDQITPDGSLKYSRTGEESFVDSSGRTVTIPRFTATQSLSPQQQAIYDINKSTEKNIAQIGNDQSNRIGGILGSPVNINNDAVESRLMELGTRRLNPQFARDEEALKTSLVNRGIQEGSAAWNAELGRFGEQKNDALTKLLLSGRGQAVQEALTERNQPINEITAILNGSQVSQPNFINTPNASVAGVDYSGLVRDDYNARMQAWKAKSDANNAMMGGLFGLAGTVGSAGIKYSDRRLKSNIMQVGQLANGLNVYRYTIFGRTETGLMADEVRALRPDAVQRQSNGFDMVDYSKAVL